MIEFGVILVSALIQITAAVLALRLIWITGRLAAWTLIALAISLMAARRLITLFKLVYGVPPYHADISVELVALAISVFMVAGIAAIAPLFRSIKHSKKELAESEERYRRVVEKSPDAIAIAVDGKGVYVNPALVRLFGAKTPEQILGRPLMEFVSPQSRGAVGERIQRILKEGKDTPLMEQKMLRLDGSEIYVETVGTPFTFKGEPAVLAVMRDITERRAMEEKLRIALTERDSVLDNAVVGIVLTRDRKIALANPKAQEFFGYTGEDVTGMSVEIAYPSHEAFERIGREAYPFITQGGTYDTEIQFKRRNGELFWARISGRAVDPADESRGVIWIVDDITERKQAEVHRALLITAVEQTAEVVIITGPDGDIQYVNPAFERVTGYRRRDVIGRTPGILKSGRHDTAFYREMWDTITRGEVWTGYLVNRRKDGGFYEQETTISPLMDSGGNISNYVAISRDVSREVMLSHAKDYFTAITSHELRTPLSKLELVRMLLGGLHADEKEKKKLDEVRGLLDESYSSFERVVYATSLISDLTVSRARDSFQSIEFYFDLLFCVEKARAEIQKEGRGISLSLSAGERVKEEKILSDRGLFRSAIDEAVSNAVKYTPDGGSVGVSADIEGNRAVIRVVDSGIGIPRDKLDAVMEPYFSLENPLRHTTSQYRSMGGGMGLGLTIIRMIMESHNGRMEIESEGDQKGARLALIFPLAREPG